MPDVSAGTRNVPDTPSLLVFDISDLLAYFPHNRSATGVQRVQIEVLNELLAGGGHQALTLCRFVERSNAWYRVPASLFVELAAASAGGSDAGDPAWQALYRQVDAASLSTPFDFAPDTVLVGLGAAWWLPNYFLHIRHLQRSLKLIYVPLVYDMIPAVAPQYCTPDLVQAFRSWLIGLLDHADYFLAISEASKADLISLAGKMGVVLEPSSVAVVRLDADFRMALSDGPDQLPPLPAQLINRPYVLLVSTVEARKNQLAALEAWRSLINSHGIEQVPMLVLVGKLGFQGPQVLDRIAQDEALRARVLMLPRVDDCLLASLYRNALFTLYPSSYEGWGLPVTESLCYGKVPLVADTSSLPEAGGDLARYFRSGSTKALVDGLETLIFNDKVRIDGQRRIAENFRPRTWSQIAGQIIEEIAGFAGRSAKVTRHAAPIVRPPMYFPMTQPSAPGLWAGIGTADTLRSGNGWYELTAKGARTRPEGGWLDIPTADDGELRVAVDIVGLPTLATTYVISDDTGKALVQGEIRAGQRRWAHATVVSRAGCVRLLLQSHDGEDEASHTDAAAPEFRKVGVGLAGIFVLPAGAAGTMLLLESIALGTMNDYDAYRRQV